MSNIWSSDTKTPYSQSKMEHVGEHFMKLCKVDGIKGDNGTVHFDLRRLDDREDMSSSHPLRLYRSHLLKLCKHIPRAQALAADYKASQGAATLDHLPLQGEDGSIVVEEINHYGNMFVQFTLDIYESTPRVWVRLYSINDDQMLMPTKIGVEIADEDNPDALASFVKRVAPPPKALVQYKLQDGKFRPVATTNLAFKPLTVYPK